MGEIFVFVVMLTILFLIEWLKKCNKHNRGFHGHSRSKPRIEFSNLYRQSAKPRPPVQFTLRQSDDALKHVFSKHDNKQIFLNDPMLFGSVKKIIIFV